MHTYILSHMHTHIPHLYTFANINTYIHAYESMKPVVHT